MSEAAPLLAVLRRIRRRVRFWAAVEGAAAGGAIGMLAAAGLLVVARHDGTPAGLMRPLLLGLACAAAGAAWRAVRRVSLAGCARHADAALGRDGADRIVSAFYLRDQVASPFVRALIADATAHARQVAPSGAVPARRPRALPVLALGAVALVVAAMVPVRSRAARTPGAAAPAVAAIPLPAGALDSERDEARRAALAGEALGDERVAALASEMDRALRRLAAGEVSDGEALDLLKAIEARAAEAARAAERERQALAATEQALAGEKSTRAAGDALAKVEKNDPGAAEKARAALGTSAADRPAETGRALSAAARGVSQALAGSQAAGEQQGGKSGERRLARDQNELAAPQPGSESTNREDERRLERLQRDLEQTGGACRDGSPNCRAEAENRARDLSRLAERAAGREALQRLERAARQLRGRIGRGELRDGGNEPTALRRFQREAAGRQGREGREGDGAEQGEGDAPGQHPGQARGDGTGGEQPGDRDKASGGAPRGVAGLADQPGGAGEGQSAGQIQAEQRATESIAGGGDGIGNEAGGEPLGKRGALDSRGHQSEAEIRNGAGPSRAEVIDGAATKGFVTRGYAQVFADYEAAVEDALGATAVPEGKRYIVRRYFDLIRPRAAGGKGK